MRVLVTGSMGWLGRHLVRQLVGDGHSVIGMDVAEGADVHGDVANFSDVRNAFSLCSFDAVIHSAALHKPQIDCFSVQAFIDVNITGTMNLLRCASAAGCRSFVFTSTTSLMISEQFRRDTVIKAQWLDENFAPLQPRNIYGATKLASEALCRQHHFGSGLPIIVLRTARFFPEQDDSETALSGPNLKVNELLHRRASVEDVARAHICAMFSAKRVGFGLYLVSAPTPFRRPDLGKLACAPAGVVESYFPDVQRIYSENGWRLPDRIDRVYDGTRITRELGFDYTTTFAVALECLKQGSGCPVVHDDAYVSPIHSASRTLLN